MKTISIRDLRQRWPEAEAALKLENEIIITRNSQPVAKLMPVSQPEITRKRWNLAAHRKWIKRVYCNKVFSSSDGQLAAARADRELI